MSSEEDDDFDETAYTPKRNDTSPIKKSRSMMPAPRLSALLHNQVTQSHLHLNAESLYTQEDEKSSKTAFFSSQIIEDITDQESSDGDLTDSSSDDDNSRFGDDKQKQYDRVALEISETAKKSAVKAKKEAHFQDNSETSSKTGSRPNSPRKTQHKRRSTQVVITQPTNHTVVSEQEVLASMDLVSFDGCFPTRKSDDSGGVLQQLKSDQELSKTFLTEVEFDETEDDKDRKYRVITLKDNFWTERQNKLIFFTEVVRG